MIREILKSEILPKVTGIEIGETKFEMTPIKW